MELCHKPLKEVAAKARELIPEGMVLIKNENRALPIIKDDIVSVFGRCQINYYASGTGSGGSVNTPYKVNLIDGLLNNGVKLNNELLELYRSFIIKSPFDDGGGLWAAEPWHQEELDISDEEIAKASKLSNKAIIVIGRTAGEDKDYKNERGSYRLTLIEKGLIERVSRKFKSTIVLLNVSNIIDMSEIAIPSVDSIIYAWHGGMEGGNGTADALCGINPPSGRLIDTIARDISLYPSDNGYYATDKIFYTEDIYVGYRYFNTFNEDAILYPFGYGLGYTSFSCEQISSSYEAGKIEFSVIVKNIGAYKGKEVVECYLEPEGGLLGRPRLELIGFKKTRMLDINEQELLSFSFNIEDFKTYDELGLSGYPSSYVLEKGQYKIYIGKNSLDIKPISFIKPIYIESNILISKCNEASRPAEAFKRIKPKKENSKYIITYENVPLEVRSLSKRIEENIPREASKRGIYKGYRLIDVKNNKCSLDSFINQLSNKNLAILARGEGMCSPKVTPGVASCFGGVSEELIEKYGIPLCATSDGPSGMRSDVGLEASLIPIGSLLASSFNEKLVEELFYYEGQELSSYNVDSLLGPGVNIHRHPLCGRNFEYFSEDPLLSGKMAAAVLRGLKKGNSSGTIKHMCCNNKEENRNNLDSILSERALREIYLRPFEIAIKEGGCMSIMSSYNLINGYHAASSYDIFNTILRQEWNYSGIVMTDWWAQINDVIDKGQPNRYDLASMIRASNDLYMVVDNYGAYRNSSRDNILKQIKEGKLTRGELIEGARHILSFILNSNAINRLDAMEPLIKVDPMDEGAQYYEAGRYTAYARLKMDALNNAQASTNVYLNGKFLAALQSNGTNGKIIRKLLIRVELLAGYYTITTKSIKNGIDIIDFKLIKD